MRTRHARKRADTRGVNAWGVDTWGFASSTWAIASMLGTPLLCAAPATGEEIVSELEYVGSHRFEHVVMWPRLFDIEYDAAHSGAALVTEEDGTFVYAVVDDAAEGNSRVVGRARYEERERFSLPVIVDDPGVLASGVSIGLLEEVDGTPLATLALTVTVTDPAMPEAIATAFVPMAWFRTIGGARIGAEVWVRLLTEVALAGTVLAPGDGVDYGLSPPPGRSLAGPCGDRWVRCILDCNGRFRGPLLAAKVALIACVARCAFVQVPCTFFGFAVANAVCYLACMLTCAIVFGGSIEALLVARSNCKAGCDRQRKQCDPTWTAPYII